MRIPNNPPVAQRSRELDALRALALLGVVVVNYTTVFRVPILKYLDVFHTHPQTVHKIADVFVGVVLESKAFAIYAMLFGAGMAAWAERGRPLVRRLVTLVCLGALHMLIWNGDILLLYGLLGLALVPFARFGPRALLLMGASFFCVAAVPGWVPYLVPVGAERERWIRAAEQAYLSSDVGVMLAFRIEETRHVIVPLLAGVVVRTLGCMLVGMAAWKANLVQTPSSHREFFARVAALGLVVGSVATTLELAGVYGLLDVGSISHTLHEISVVSLAVGYGAGALRLFAGAFARPAEWLASLGRVSLTSYVTQSLVGGLIFYGYGLGLFGSLGSATTVGIAVSVYGMEWLGARFLLRGAQGPLEKLWRYASTA